MAGKRRYPGVTYFRESDKDVFQGRTDDSRLLFQQLLVNQTVVLHAESGVGKSSLIRAGLLPTLSKFNQERKKGIKKGRPILAVTVVWGIKPTTAQRTNVDAFNKEAYLVDKIIAEIEKQSAKNGIELSSLPIIETMQDLWYSAKQVQQAGFDLMLILDQFEEVESYATEQIDHLAKELASIFQPILPEIYNEQIIKHFERLSEPLDEDETENNTLSTEIRFLEKRLGASALFTVREDKLGVLTKLKTYLPSILKNDYQLLCLDEKGARDAITIPATLKGSFSSQTFTITKEVIDKILDSIRDTENELFDPLEIQIICNNLENKIKGTKNRIEIKDLGTIANIINQFYKKAWQTAKKQAGLSPDQFDMVRKRIIEKLLINGKRVKVIEDRFTNDSDEKAILSIVEANGLLRKSSGSDGSSFYELVHDRFIRPVSKDLKDLKVRQKTREENIQKEKKFRRVSIALILLLLVVGVTLFLTNGMRIFAKQDQILSISRTAGKKWPTLAYTLAKNHKNEHERQTFNSLYPLKDLEQYLNKSDSLVKPYLIQKFPLRSGIVAVEKIKGSDHIRISEMEHTREWNFKTLNLKKSEGNHRKPLKRVATAKGNRWLFHFNDSLELRSTENQKLAVFPVADATFRSSNLDISDDGKYIIIEENIFDVETTELIAPIPEFGGMNDQMTARFLHNDHRFAVGYWSGYTLVFDIDPKNNPEEPITLKKVFEPVGNSINTVIQDLAVDYNNKWLVAGDRNGNIGLYDLDSPKMNNGAEKVLIGHSDEINCIGLSGDSLLLSGSKDRNAILWDLELGEPRDFIRGMNSDVIRVGFLGENSEFFTATKDGLLYYWKKGIGSQLFSKGEMIKASPLDYAVVGIRDKDWKATYKSESLHSLYSGMANYLLSFPSTNNYPRDGDYHDILKSASEDLEQMYHNLIEHPDYESKTNEIAKKELKRLYTDFQFRTKPKLLQTKTLNQEATYNREVVYLTELKKLFLQDTTDFWLGISCAKEWIRKGDNYGLKDPRVDGNLDEQKLKKCYKEAEELLRIVTREFEGLEEIEKVTESLANSWFFASYFALFDEKYDFSIIAAENSLRLNPKEQRALSHMALAYILHGEWPKAEKIIKTYKDKNITYFESIGNGGTEKFASILINDIVSLRKNNITHTDFQKALSLVKSKNLLEELEDINANGR